MVAVVVVGSNPLLDTDEACGVLKGTGYPTEEVLFHHHNPELVELKGKKRQYHKEACKTRIRFSGVLFIIL